MEKEKIQEQITKKLKEVEELKLKLENDSVKNGLLDVPELGIEIEIDITNKGMSYDKIMSLPAVQEKIKNGWRLLSLCREGDYVNELAFLENNTTYSNILKINGSSTHDDFFVSQMFKRNANNGYVAWFCAVSDYSSLDSIWDSDDSYSDLGVRFARKKNFKVKKK